MKSQGVVLFLLIVLLAMVGWLCYNMPTESVAVSEDGMVNLPYLESGETVTFTIRRGVALEMVYDEEE